MLFSLVWSVDLNQVQAEPNTKNDRSNPRSRYYYSDRFLQPAFQDTIAQTLDELDKEDFKLKKELIFVLHGLGERYKGKYTKAVEILGDIAQEANARMDASDPAMRWELAKVVCETQAYNAPGGG